MHFIFLSVKAAAAASPNLRIQTRHTPSLYLSLEPDTESLSPLSLSILSKIKTHKPLFSETTDNMAERKATKSTHVGVPPPEPEHLPCPRCNSTNTKFCYYNNYNFSQPRHFCKSCRRYWTHGGTLRDIPIGGGSRKNAKRSLASVSAASTAVSGVRSVFSLPHHEYRHLPATGSQLLVPISSDQGGSLSCVNEGKIGGSFTSLLTTQGAGLWSLGGFGSGLDDLGFGLGRTAWPFHGVVEGGTSAAANTWQLENGQGGFVGGGDCFSLPELAISTPGSMLK